jgi:hypothetical protein
MLLYATFDEWMAKRVFSPIIIRVCQWTKTNQYVFADYAMVMAVFCFAGVSAQMIEFGLYVVGFIFAAISVAVLALSAFFIGTPRPPSSFWRAFGWVLLALTALEIFLGVANRQFTIMIWIFHQFAQYARLIDSIPPREEENKKVAHANR